MHGHATRPQPPAVAVGIGRSAVEGVGVTFPNIFNGKRVFITGHTGFKGSWLASWMHLLGADVTGYALPPDSEGSHFERLGLAKKIRHIEGDLRDAGRLRFAMKAARPEFVF